MKKTQGNSMQDKRVDVDKIKGFLENTLNKLKTESDIETLTSIKKVYKKTVPFWLRSYVASFLIDEILGCTKEGGAQVQKKFDSGRVIKSKFARKNDTTAAPNNKTFGKALHNDGALKTTIITGKKDSRAKATLDPAKTKNIFISIGKMRRIFPRDIMGLLYGVAKIDKGYIGAIKIFSNYTFVELDEDMAQVAIDKLSGYEYKHTTLTVDWAKGGEKDHKKQDSSREIVIKLGDKSDTATQKTATAESNVASVAGEQPNQSALKKQDFAMKSENIKDPPLPFPNVKDDKGDAASKDQG